MTRIVGGVAGGRHLVVPQSVTRPTAERVREALFSSLQTRVELPDACVLDLYAGSGALGLEALSRGAAIVTLVEADVRATKIIRRNIADLKMPGAELIADRVERLATKPAPRSYDLVLADPPYALSAENLATILAQFINGGWLASDALVVVERSSRDLPWKWPSSLVDVGARRYGEAMLWYGRRS